MQLHHEPSVDSTILGAAAMLAIAMGGQAAESTGSVRPAPPRTTTPPVGAWRSSDGSVRLELRCDGTYDGRVAGRRRRAHGTYRFDGATLTLNDDSGLKTAITVRERELDMAGHRLGRV